MRKTMPSTTDSANIIDLPSPYSLKSLIVRQTQALEAHTKADDEWRATVMELFEERLKEKDRLVDLVKKSWLRDEKDKVRWYRMAVFLGLVAAAFGGLDISHFVGLI